MVPILHARECSTTRLPTAVENWCVMRHACTLSTKAKVVLVTVRKVWQGQGAQIVDRLYETQHWKMARIPTCTKEA